MSKYSVETSFLGQRPPDELKLLVKELKTAKKDSYARAIDQVVTFLIEGQAPDFNAEIDNYTSRLLFGGFYAILKKALRHPHLTPSSFKRDLSDLHGEVLDLLVGKVFQGKQTLEHISRLQAPSTPANSEFVHADWRVDVAISNNHLSKLLQPEVLLNIGTTDSEDVRLALSVGQFHALRRSTANILHDVCQLQERKFMQ